ncbi:MAG: hypothetical protein WC969_09865 [Elusimicrobiota bacterium]|jgi:hypothetical protein
MPRRAGAPRAALRAVCHLFSAAIAAGFLLLPFLSAPARAQSFTGDFSQAGGAVYDSGYFDELNKVVLSTVSGTPYLYAVGYQTTGGANEDWTIVKYDLFGAMVASRTVHESANDRAYDAALDSAGNLYVVGEVAASSATSALYKFDANLVFLTSHSIAGSAQAVGIRKSGTEKAFTLSFNANQVFLSRFNASVLLGGTGTELRVVTSYINNVYNARSRFAIDDSLGEVIFELGFSTGTSPANVQNRFELYKWNGEVADLSLAAPTAMTSVGFDARSFKGNDIVRAPDGLLYAVGLATNGPVSDSVLVVYDPSAGLGLQSTAAVAGIPFLWSVGVDTVTGHVLASCGVDTYRYRYDGIGNLYRLPTASGGGRSMAVASSSQVFVGGDAGPDFVTKRLNVNGSAGAGTGVVITTSAVLDHPTYNSQRSMARASNGDLYLAHSKAYGGGKRIFLARSTDNGATWADTTAAPIENIPSPVGDQTDPALAIDSTDKIHVVFAAYSTVIDASGPEGKVAYVQAAAPGTSGWSSYQVLPYNAYNGIEVRPAIAVDSLDGLHVAWYGQDNGSEQGRVRYSSRSATSPGFGPYIDISYDSADTLYPALVVDKDDIPHVVAQHRQGAGTGAYESIVHSSRTAGGWGAWEQVAFIGSYYEITPSVVVDSSNGLHVAWTGTDGTFQQNYQIKYASKTVFAPAWNSFVQVTNIPTAPQYSPSLTLDAANKLYVVWTGSDVVSDVNVKISSCVGGAWAGWWANLTSGAGDRRHAATRWAGYANNGGQLDVSWVEDGGGSGVLRALHDTRATLPTGFSVSTTGVTRVWNGSGGDTLVSNGANWVGGVAPQPGDSIQFGASPTGITMDAGIAIASTTLMPNFTSTITITASFENLLDFYASTSAMGAVHFGSNEIKFGGNIDISSSVVFYMDTSTLTFNGAGNQSMRRRGGVGPIEAGNQIIQKPAGTRITMGSDAILYGNFTMLSGTFTTTYSAVFKGDMRQSGGYFDVPNATGVFSGTTPQTMQVTGGMGTPFKAVRVTNPTEFVVDAPLTTALFEVLVGSVTVKFHHRIGAPPYYDFQISSFVVDASGYETPATLRSMTKGSAWRLLGLSSYTVRNAVIEDSDASSYAPGILAERSHDGGGRNKNWTFFDYSGNFAGTGPRIAKRSGGVDLALKTLVDPVNSWVYSITLSFSSTPFGTSAMQDTLVSKYDLTGTVLLSSRSLSALTMDGGASAIDSAGNLFVSMRSADNSTVGIYELDSSLNIVNMVYLDTSSFHSVEAILATGSYVYAAGQSQTWGRTEFIRLNAAGLTPVNNYSYYAPSTMGLNGLSRDLDGNLYFLVAGNTDARLVKISPALAVLNERMVSADLGSQAEGHDIQVLGNGLFLATFNPSGDQIFVKKYDLNLNPLGNAYAVTNASAAYERVLDLATDGSDLYLGGTVNGPSFAAFRFSPILQLISSATYAAGNGQLYGLTVSTGQQVYLAGTVPGTDLDALLGRRTLAGTPPAVGVGYNGLAAFFSYNKLFASITKDNLVYEYTNPTFPVNTSGTMPRSVIRPGAMALDSLSNLWVSAANQVAAPYNDRLVRITYTGAGMHATSTSAVLSAALRDPSAIAFQSGNGDLWVANRGPAGSPSFASIVHFSNLGTLPTPSYGDSAVSTFATSAYVYRPTGLAFDGAGNLWAASASSGVIRMFPNSSNFIGNAPVSTLTAVAHPYALAFDQMNGNLFVSDTDTDLPPGNGKLWVFKNKGTLGSPNLDTTPTLLQSGVDVLGMTFREMTANAPLYGSDFASDSVIQLSTAIPVPPRITGGITGTVSYSGTYAGASSPARFYVVVSTQWPEFNTMTSYEANAGVLTGAFEIPDLEAPNTYYAFAFISLDGTFNEPGPFEPQGTYHYSVQTSTGLEPLPIFVTANSTAANVSIGLRDVFLASVTVTNNSVQQGDLRVQVWRGVPDAAQPYRALEDSWAAYGVTNFDYFTSLSTNDASIPYYFRAYVDSNHNYGYDSGEDVSVSSGPIAALTSGTTYPVELTISPSPGGTLFVSTMNLAPASLPTSAMDVPMLRLTLAASGGNVQWNSLNLGLLGDAPPWNVQARVYRDENGDGTFQNGTDWQIGSVYFSGNPPTAQVLFWSTQTITASSQNYFVGLNYWNVPAGGLIGVGIDSPERFGIGYGEIAPQPALYPVDSGMSRLRLTLAARPTDGGYSYPGANPNPWGGFDSGVFLQPGQNVQVLAAGTWGTGDYAASGADGVGSNGGLDPALPLGALVGRVGSGAWFLIGSSATFAATQSGTLWLAMNDSDYMNNFGQLNVEIGLVASNVTRTWLGSSGLGPNASYDANWQGGAKPLPGEKVLFDGAVSTQPCLWDIYGANLGVLTLKSNYTGTVEVTNPMGGYLNLDFSSNVYVQGGRLRVGNSAEISVAGRLEVTGGGILDVSGTSARVRFSRKGLLVKGGGTVRSAGVENWGGPTLQSLDTMSRFFFTVDDGTIDFRNSAGLEIANAETVVIGTYTYCANLEKLRFNDWVTTPARTTPAMKLYIDQVITRTFTGLQFGWGFPVNIDATGAIPGSVITAQDATGERRGSPYEVDPNGVIYWNPDGGGTAQISGTISLSGSPVDDYTVLATTSPEPNGGETIYSATQLSAVGAYSLNTLQAPNTYYVFAWRGPSWAHPEGHTARGGWLHAGLARSEPVFVANGTNLSNIDITLSAWGGVNGWVNNNSSQFGPVRVQPWIGDPATPAVSTRSLSAQLASWGGSYEFGAPAGADQVLAFVDVNGNGLADPFEAQSTAAVSAVVAGSTRVVGNFTLTGGGTAPGGYLSLSTSALHPGALSMSGSNPLIRLDLYNASPSSAATLSALKYDLVHGDLSHSNMVELWRDANGNGVIDTYMPAGGMPEDNDSMVGSLTMTPTADVSSGALTFWNPQTVPASSTRTYLLSLNLMGGMNGTFPAPVDLSMSATYFTMGQGTMLAQPSMYPVHTGLLPVRFSISAMENAGYNGPNSGGMDTGLQVDPGLAVTVSATGTWTVGSGLTGPGGHAGTGNQGVSPDANIGELMGRVGGWEWGSNWVRIGTGTTFTANQSGRLFLAANDYSGDYYNNSGRLFVDYSVSGTTTAFINGAVFYPGGVTSGNLIVRAVQPWAYPPFVSTVTLPMGSGTPVAGGRTYAFSISGLPQNSYRVEAELSVDVAKNAKTEREFYCQANSTTTVALTIPLGFGSIAGTVNYPSTGTTTWGDYIILAATHTNMQGEVDFVGIHSQSSSGAYTMSGLPSPATYYLLSYRGYLGGKPNGADALGFYGVSTATFVDLISGAWAPVFVDTGAAVTGKDIALFDHGAVSGQMTKHASVPDDKPIIAIVGHGFFGKPGYRFENQNYLDQSPGMAMMTNRWYQVGLLSADADYSVFMFSDANGNGQYDTGELFGQSANLVSVPVGGYANADVYIAAASAPGGVTGFTGTPLSSATLHWSWDAAPGAVSYKLLSSTGGSLVQVSASTTTYDQWFSTANYVSPFVAIRAANAQGDGAASTPLSPLATLAVTPGAVTELFTGVSSAAFTWSYQGNSTSPATTYEVRRATSPSAPYALLFLSTGAPVLDLSVAPSQTYHYRVRALNYNGVQSSTYSAYSAVTPTASGPSAAGLITYAGRQAGSVLVHAYATSTFTGAPVRISTLPSGGQLPYYLSLSGGTTYWLRAFVDADGNGLRGLGEDFGQYVTSVAVAGAPIGSRDFSIAVDTMPPASPVGVVATAGIGKVLLTWNAPTRNYNNTTLSDLAAYRVQRTTYSAGTFATITTSTVFGTTGAVAGTLYTDPAPASGAMNYYRVLAVDYGQNQSLPSGVISAQPSLGGTISGDFQYVGVSTYGVNRVRISTSPDAAVSFYAETTLTPFSFTGLPDGSYYLRGFRDLNGDNQQDAAVEPSGTYGGISAPFPIPIANGNAVPGTRVNICDRTAIAPNSQQNGTIGFSDCVALDQGPSYYTDIYTFRVGGGAAGSIGLGTDVEIRLESGANPNRLFLLAPDGNVVAQDNRTGGAYIRHTVNTAGIYRIEPTSFDPAMTFPYALRLNVVGGFNASIGGTLSYAGSRPGRYYVQVFTSPDTSAFPVRLSSFTAAGAYSVSGMPDGTYYLRAYKDANSNGVRDRGEPAAVYGVSDSSPTRINIVGGVVTPAAIDLSVLDPVGGRISGQLLREGSAAGTIRVAVGTYYCPTCTHDFTEVAFTTLPAAGAYALDFIAPATNYAVRAYLDQNASDSLDGLETAVSSSPVTVSPNSTTTLNLLLRDMGTGASGNSSLVATIAYPTLPSTGPFYVGIGADSELQYIPYYVILSSAGTFLKTGILGNTTYYIGAFLDRNGNGSPDRELGEPMGGLELPNGDSLPLYVPASSSVVVSTTLTLTDPPTGSVFGQVTYNGSAPLGQSLRVQAWNPQTSGGEWNWAQATIERVAGQNTYPYRLDFLGAATSYSLMAYVDANGSGRSDFGEPMSQYGQTTCMGNGPCYGSPVTVSTGAGTMPTYGINIEVRDPGSYGNNFSNVGQIEAGVVYLGVQGGPVFIRVYDNATLTGAPRWTQRLDAPAGPGDFRYRFTDLPYNTTFYFDAFRDPTGTGVFNPAFQPYASLGSAMLTQFHDHAGVWGGILTDRGAGGSVNSFGGTLSTATGGVRFDGGATDLGIDLAVDNVSGGGPYAYVLGTTLQNTGTVLSLAKIDSSGALKSSRTLTSDLSGVMHRMLVDPAGNLFVGYGLPEGDRGAVIEKLDGNLVTTAQVRLTTSNANTGDGINGMTYAGGKIYASIGSFGPQGQPVLRIDPATLAADATGYYYFPGSPNNGGWFDCSGIATDGTNVYALERRKDQNGVGVLAAIVKFGPGLGAPTAVKDVSYYSSLASEGGELAVAGDGSVYLSYHERDTAMITRRLRRFDSAFNETANVSVSPVLNHFGGDMAGGLRLGPDGTVYLGYEAGTNAGDIGVNRYDANLNLLATRTFDGRDNALEDMPAGLDVVDSTNVYLAGTVNNGQNLDWIVLRTNMNASGAVSSAGSAGTGTLSETVSGSIRYAGTLASSGTIRAMLFPVGAVAPIRSSTAAFGAVRPYLFNNVPMGQYVLRAFVDQNSNFIPEEGEPAGRGASSGFYFSGGSQTGLDVSICDRRPISLSTEIAGSFSAADCTSADRSGAYQKVYTFNGSRGQIVTIDLIGTGFYDSYLNVMDPDGELLSSDDDSGGNGNARVTNLILPKDGLYSIAASPFSAAITGGFTLKMGGSGGGALGSITGNISYNGSQGAAIKAGLFSSLSMSSNSYVAGTDLSGPGPYTFGSLKTEATYYIAAFADANFNGNPDPGEDFGTFGVTPGLADPLYLRAGQALTGADFSLIASTSIAVPQAGVTGVVSYDGTLSGELRVEMWADSRFEGRPVGVRSIPTGVGPYDVSVPGGQPYFVRAYLDVNHNFLLDPDEPRGMYQPRNQGAEAVYTPMNGMIAGIDFPIYDATAGGLTGGYPAGEGWAVAVPTAVPSGATVSTINVSVLIGANGIEPTSGVVVFGVPMGWAWPQTTQAGGWGYVSVRVSTPSGLLPTVTAAPIYNNIGSGAVEARVTSATKLIAGSTLTFTYNNVWAPCYSQDNTFRIGSASSGTLAGAAPMPLISGEPTIALAPGTPQYFMLRNGWFSLSQGQTSDRQVLDAKDNCGNTATVLVSTTATLRARRYDYATGLFQPEGALKFSSAATGQYVDELQLTFTAGRSSRTFVARSTTTGDMNVEILSMLQGPATSSFYAGLSVVATNTLTGVSIATQPYMLGFSSATIIPNGDPSSPNQAYVNFDLASANMSWTVMVASIPYKGGETTPDPIWQTWGYGQPTRGQVTWDGRYSPWLNNGSRVPTGSYFVRVEVGMGVRDDSLQVRVITPQLSGQVLDSGTVPQVPLSGVNISAYGPFGGQNTVSDSRGGFVMPGLSAGDYQLYLTKDGYLAGSGSMRIDSNGIVSTFSATSADVTLASTPAGALNAYLNRASALFVTPSISTDPAKPLGEVWGGMQIHTSSYTRAFFAPLHLPAGTTTFDDGGQWDNSVQRFVTKTLLRYDVPSDTYTVRANVFGFDEAVATGVFVERGATYVNLPAFTRQLHLGGTVYMPAGMNPAGLFVSVNAIPLSTTTQLPQGFGGVWLPPGVVSGAYDMGGLVAGEYRMVANTRGFAARTLPLIGMGGGVDISTADFTFSDPSASNVISGTVTVKGDTTGFPNLDSGYPVEIHVNAWAPGSMNFGQAEFSIYPNAVTSSANFHITGLDPGVEYQLYAWMEQHGGGDFDVPGGFPKRVTIATVAPFKNPEASLQFTFEASSGAIDGMIYLPEGSNDFGSIDLQGETISSVRPERVGEKFQVQYATADLSIKCTGTGAAVPAATGLCPNVGGIKNSSATFHVSNMNTETVDVLFTYRTTGMSRKHRVAVVNGLTTSATVDFRVTDVRSSTYSISGTIANQVQNSLFNTNDKIFVGAATVPLRDANNRLWAIDPAIATRSTDSLARVVALRQEFGTLNVAITTTANPAVDRVGFLDMAGRFAINNVAPGVYFVRTANLRTCATCETLVPLTGQMVSVTSYSVAGVTITLRDGYSVAGTVSLDNGILDARTLRLNLYNQRQELVRSTNSALGNAGAGAVANSLDYTFRNLPAGDFYTLSVEDVAEVPKYAGRPIKFPDPSLSPKGLTTDLTRQSLTLLRAAFITGRVKDANTGEQITKDNATMLAPNFKIAATANPWVEGGYVVAAASMSLRPIRADGTFLVGPLIPDTAYDLRLGQDRWDLAYLAQGSQNYAPMTVAALKPGPGETKDVGTLGLNQGQSVRGTVVDALSTTTALGSIKVVARPSFGASDIVVQTYTNASGEYTIWVSTFVSQQYDLTFAPRDGNTASSGKVYREQTLYNFSISTTQPPTMLLTELLGQVTGQVLTADGGALSYPFGGQKGYPAAALFLQPKNVVPKSNPLGDIEAQTDAFGAFSIVGLSTGTYTLRAVSLGYSVLNADVTVATGSFCVSTAAASACTTALTLARGAVVTGRILLPSGSAPSDTQVGGIAAANRGFTEFVIGAVETDPVARTISGYSISGFKPGVTYNLVLTPKEGNELSFPPEGQGVTFTSAEAETTKSINLTYGATRPDCEADAKLSTITAVGRQFQIKITCSQPMRNQVATDNDLDALLTISTANSSGVAYAAPEGTGQLLGGDKRIAENRRVLTALYRTAANETRFSLRLEGYSQTVDQTTGRNYQYSRIFDFFTGLESARKERVSNIQGGNVRLEPTDEDVLLGRDERFRADIPPGTFETDSEYSQGLGAGASTQFTLELRRARSRQSASAAYVKRFGYAPQHLAVLESPKAMPVELYRAMASTGINPLGAFYDVFLPLGIRSQLKKAVELTFSYDLSASTSANESDVNVWYYNPTQGRYVMEANNRRLDTVNKTVTVSVDHFSTFVVLASTPIYSSQTPYTGGEIKVFNFPNPADCIRHTKSLNDTAAANPTVSFDGTMIHYDLPAGETSDLKIKIYDVAGELVREIPQGQLVGGVTYYSPWDCKNDGGKTVASGVYIGQLKWGSNNKFFKMAIIKGSGL